MNKKIIIISLLGLVSFAHAEPQVSQQYSFGKGINLNQLATEIDPAQSPDMCNCVSEPVGAAKPRNGTERLFAQAVSSFPVTSLYKIYAGTSSEKALIFTNKNSIHYTTGGFIPIVYQATNTLTEYDNFEWVQMQDKAILLGGYDNDIKEFDPITKKVNKVFVSSTLPVGNIYVRAKHGLVIKNYLMLSNVMISTNANFETNLSTIYPSRTYFSKLDSRSSFTAFNFIDFATGDGEEITGAGSIYGNANFFKPSKIQEVAFTVLGGNNGDQVATEIVNDFGLRASKALVSARLYYAFAADDGIRVWNGSRTSRLTPSDESRVISDDIKPIINKLIRLNTYTQSVLNYYPKKEWLIFSYNDPLKSTKNRLNSMMIYDFKIGQWFPFCGISAQALTVQSGLGDGGELFYGDNDGYIVEMDKYTRANDMRREIVIDSVDTPSDWVGSTPEANNVKTGTTSAMISVTVAVPQSSMTRIGTFNFGVWQDNAKITRSDKLEFKVFSTNIQNISSLRVDLEVNTVSSAFDTNFSSVTLASSTFSGGDRAWTTFEIPLSSFPIRSDWVDFDSETVPFANTLFFYGIRFVLDGVSVSSVCIDDIRVVQATDENPINFYRFTKLFDFQSENEKNIGSMLLTLDKAPTTNLNIDVYNNFGSRVRTEPIASDVANEVISVNYTTGTLAVLNAYDFDVIRTSVISTSASQFYNGVANSDYIWLNDRDNNRILKLNRNNFGVLSMFGSFGSGTTNFNLIHQTAINDTHLVAVDQVNQKIKQFNQKDNSFVREIGGLGSSTNTAKFHQPTGIAVNNNNIFVSDEGNYRWVKFDISTMGFVDSAAIDYNTLGETTFAMDEKSLYAAYISGVEDSSTNSEIILEERNIANYEIKNRTVVKPLGVETGAAYGHTGDICLLGKYIFIVFNDNEDDLANANFFIQKRLKHGFDLVKEKKFPKQRMSSLLGDGMAYKPKTNTQLINLKADGRYVQLKYYGSSMDNDFTIYNQSFLLDVKSQGY